MRTKKNILKNIVIYLSLVVWMAGMGIAFVYAGDNTDRFLKQDTYTFSPGYVNAAMYQARTIADQANITGDEKKESFLDSAINYVKDKLEDNTHRAAQQAKEPPAPVLQQKTSVKGTGTSNVSNVIAGAVGSNVKIGTGTDQRDIDGNLVSQSGKRMVSEIIDGKRNVYVGFTNIGVDSLGATIGKAVAGDNIIMKGGQYSESGTFYFTSGVSIYGGYNDGGVRDLNMTSTTITIDRSYYIGGSTPTQLNGITISSNSYGPVLWVMGASKLSIVNSTFNCQNANSALQFGGGSVTIEGNTFNTVCAIRFNGTTAYLTNNIFNGWGGFSGDGSVGTIYSQNNNFYTRWNGAAGGYTVVSTSDYYVSSRFIDFPFGGGTLAVVDRSQNPNQQVTAGSAPVLGTASTQIANVSLSSLANSLYNTDYTYDSMYAFMDAAEKGAGELSHFSSGDIAKNLLTNKNYMTQGSIGPSDNAILWKIVNKALAESALIPEADMVASGEIAVKLSDILKNPTEDQRVMLDAVESILIDIENMENQPGGNPELKKATDELMQAVANVLLAQAIPDLLKEGDMTNIKSIFSNLDSAKTKVILEYNESTKPYYDEVKKILQRNAEALQTSNILQKNTLQKDIEELPRSEIDKIIEKLKNKEKRAFEEEYLLQQEAKYRKAYVEPNKKKLEEGVKNVMQDFTQKLSATLETTKQSAKK